MKQMAFMGESESLRARLRFLFGKAFGLLKPWINQINLPHSIMARLAFFSGIGRAGSSALEKMGYRILIQSNECLRLSYIYFPPFLLIHFFSCSTLACDFNQCKLLIYALLL